MRRPAETVETPSLLEDFLLLQEVLFLLPSTMAFRNISLVSTENEIQVSSPRFTGSFSRLGDVVCKVQDLIDDETTMQSPKIKLEELEELLGFLHMEVTNELVARKEDRSAIRVLRTLSGVSTPNLHRILSQIENRFGGRPSVVGRYYLQPPKRRKNDHTEALIEYLGEIGENPETEEGIPVGDYPEVVKALPMMETLDQTRHELRQTLMRGLAGIGVLGGTGAALYAYITLNR